MLAAAAARWQGDDAGLDPRQRLALALAALGGAVLGAYGLQLPADLFGWRAPPPVGASGDDLPFGGRTVLGGILGGWVAVEWIKPRLGIRHPTGDSFALPLAVALAFGRIGCLVAGCCAGTTRFPVQGVEIIFHASAALLLGLAARRHLACHRRLAIYVTAYGTLRFVLEFWRLHPPVLFGLTWYQLLALALTTLGAATWWRRELLTNRPGRFVNS